jgi:hypothetical protein
VSYGLCGILVMDRDVRAVAGFLEEHQVCSAMAETQSFRTYCGLGNDSRSRLGLQASVCVKHRAKCLESTKPAA